MKLVIAILALVCLGYQSEAQTKLKIRKEKMERYNSYTRTWSGWPGDFTYFQTGSEPILQVKNLDNSGDFLVNCWIDGERNSTTVTYTGYDAVNNWYKYTNRDGDDICIVGATMSFLARNGWPGNTVQIYFWDNSKNIGVIYE